MGPAVAGGYVGRFAPSPTGPLHLGSLVAALASYLDARHRQGRWLLRMEDLDSPRVVPGCADTILRTLEAFGLTWDGSVMRQSERDERYRATLAELGRAGHTYPCSCSRRERSEQGETGYPGTCRAGPRRPGSTATRLRLPEGPAIGFMDRIQGWCDYPRESLGDVVLERRDGRIAYQLAVVVDDADQQVTDVVRGADLLPSTAWQIELQRLLGLSCPHYAHVPLVVEADGTKLAKSRRSVPIDPRQGPDWLRAALRLLGQDPFSELTGDCATLLGWAIPRWDPNRLNRMRIVPVQTVRSIPRGQY